MYQSREEKLAAQEAANKEKIQLGVKIGGIVMAVLFFLGIVLSNIHVIDDTQTGYKVWLGEVGEQSYGAGLHFTVPFVQDMGRMITAQDKYEVAGLTIPTQDRFNSTANVTVLYNIKPDYVVRIRKEYGTQQKFIDTTLRQHLRSIIRNEGRLIENSRGLAVGGNITQMQENTMRQLTEALGDNGLVVHEVLIQDIEFDPRIADQILATQRRQEQEEAQKSQLAIDKTKADQQIEKARGEAESAKLAADAAAYQVVQQAEAEATRVREAAEAEAFRVRQSAEAERFNLEQIAEGNKALNASLTKDIIRLKELEVQKAEAGIGWQGQVPANVTLFGEGAEMPLFLKQMK